MAGRKKDKSFELDDIDGELDDLDVSVSEDEETRSVGAIKSRGLAWQRLEQRRDNQWLHSQIADWDEYLDIH